MKLETKINAKFILDAATATEQESLDTINAQVEEICESLQTVFRTLIIQMLSMKQEKGDNSEST